MQRFAELFGTLDQTTSTTDKVDAMANYFRSAPPESAAWGAFFLTGRRLKRLLPWAAIGEWTLTATGFESWLLEECWAVVGDGAETAALILDQVTPVSGEPLALDDWMNQRILPLRQMDNDAQRTSVIEWLRQLNHRER